MDGIQTQKTLKKSVTLQGIGLHSGETMEIRLHPALPNSGVTLIRSDLKDRPELTATYSQVSHTQLATTLGQGASRISTVEHLFAALYGLGVDNVCVEVNGPEIPIMDGSAAPFCEAITEAGIQSQVQKRKFLRIRERIELKLAEKWAIVEPCDRFEIQASIDWDHPAIGYQEFHYIEGKSSFASDLAQARTFGFLKDVEKLRRAGLARGGSLENAVVLDEGRVLNPEGLRYPDEFIRHKVLDALGDFKLAGYPILGRFRLHRSGHEVHAKLLAQVFSNPAHYEIVESGWQPVSGLEFLPTQLVATTA